LAHVKLRQKDYAAAEQLARRAVEISQRVDGPEARTTANALQWLGVALAANKKFAESESACREALKINRQNCDANHWAVREAVLGLTEALRAQGKEQALEELENEQQEWAAAKAKRSEIGQLTLPHDQQPRGRSIAPPRAPRSTASSYCRSRKKKRLPAIWRLPPADHRRSPAIVKKPRNLVRGFSRRFRTEI
jgi:tetratricopeptide (TPR) repeat protein